MPELPEAEVVRRGLHAHVAGRVIADADIRGERVARRYPGGATGLERLLTGTRVIAADRRGKYLWLVMEPPAARSAPGGGGSFALIAHLGMSGQMLVEAASAPREKHAHAVFGLLDDPAPPRSHAGAGPVPRPGASGTSPGGDPAAGADPARQLRFVDQRTFGGLSVSALTAPVPGHPYGVPEAIGHIAADPLEEAFDAAAVTARIRRSASVIKRLLLDQRILSGIGNIYADEALWRARLHGQRPGRELTGPAVRRLLGHAREVMEESLLAGGTSFDALYVDVEGASGYFARDLAVYGRQGQPCRRCGQPIRREAFMNRSSFSCPRCQPRPRQAARSRG